MRISGAAFVTRIEGLAGGTTFRLRIKCRNSNGESKWSEEEDVETLDDEDDGNSGVMLPPLVWLFGAAAVLPSPHNRATRITILKKAVADVLIPRVTSYAAPSATTRMAITSRICPSTAA